MTPSAISHTDKGRSGPSLEPDQVLAALLPWQQRPDPTTGVSCCSAACPRRAHTSPRPHFIMGWL